VKGQRGFVCFQDVRQLAEQLFDVFIAIAGNLRHKLKICLFVKGQHITVAAAFFRIFSPRRKSARSLVESVTRRLRRCPAVVEYRPV
jgi:hypothetical protein